MELKSVLKSVRCFITPFMITANKTYLKSGFKLANSCL
jgi:hypothetical protein